MLSQELQILPGNRRLGRYTLLCHFATGGMANVYLARFTGPDGFEKTVAIKQLHQHLSHSEQFIKMFVDEARLAAQISHHNVVQVLELGVSQDHTHFIAMEYVEGDTLASLLRRTAPPWPVCVKIVAEAAAGLHAAHELCDKHGKSMGVVHRDVSPQNILISYAGQVKVLDFGIARAHGSLHETKAGTVQGKYAYMSPEQLRTEPVDRRSDIFALGVVLYEISTRTRLFKASSEAATLAKALHDPIVPPTERISDYPPALEKIVMRALEREPAKRYPSAQEMQDDLEALLVEQGKTVLHSKIARLMSKTFQDRIKHKKALLCQAAKLVEGMPDLEITTNPTLTDTTPAAAAAIEQQQLQSRFQSIIGQGSRTLRLFGLTAAVTVGVIVGLYFAFRTPSPPAVAAAVHVHQPPTVEDAGAPRDARAAFSVSSDGGTDTRRQVRIAIRALPARAAITVDGEQFGNRFEVEREAASGGLAVVIAAPGYHDHRFRASLEKNGSWVISLRRASRPPSQISRTGTARSSGRARAHTKTMTTPTPEEHKGLGGTNKVLMPNPYQK